MLDIAEISDEISRLETSEVLSYSVIQKLAWLYVVRDHNVKYESLDEQKDVVKVDKTSSDFLILASTKSVDKVLMVVDELAETVRTLHPRVYEAFMKRLYDA